jgi:hypothetical protein
MLGGTWCMRRAYIDISISLLFEHLTEVLINVLVLAALRHDTGDHCSVASSHQRGFGST